MQIHKNLYGRWKIVFLCCWFSGASQKGTGLQIEASLATTKKEVSCTTSKCVCSVSLKINIRSPKTPSECQPTRSEKIWNERHHVAKLVQWIRSHHKSDVTDCRPEKRPFEPRLGHLNKLDWVFRLSQVHRWTIIFQLSRWNDRKEDRKSPQEGKLEKVCWYIYFFQRLRYRNFSRTKIRIKFKTILLTQSLRYLCNLEVYFITVSFYSVL